jgi:hypothetical protein
MHYAAIAPLLTVAALCNGCGGGGEVGGVIGFIPPGSGQVYIDANPATVLYEPLACQTNGNECRLSLAPDSANDLPPYERHFNYTGQSIPDAVQLAKPQVDPCAAGKAILNQDVLDLGACFKGRFIDPMTALSDDGKKRFFWAGGFDSHIGRGIWVNANDANEEFHVIQTQNSSTNNISTNLGVGCQKNSGKITPMSLAASYSVGLTPNTPRVFTAFIFTSSTTPEWSGNYHGQGAIVLYHQSGAKKTLVWKSASPSCT